MKTSLEMNYVPKGWGFEKWIVNCDEYCGKLLYFVKGKMCSWHYHKLKDEVFYIQSGKILVKYSDEDELENAKEVFLTSSSHLVCPVTKIDNEPVSNGVPGILTNRLKERFIKISQGQDIFFSSWLDIT